jgi:hypothetical protein
MPLYSLVPQSPRELPPSLHISRTSPGEDLILVSHVLHHLPRGNLERWIQKHRRPLLIIDDVSVMRAANGVL